MKDGFIQQIGTPEEVFSHPNNLFVAGFIGTPQMNFFDAKLEKDASGSYYVMLKEAKIELPKDKKETLSKIHVQAQDIVLGIRPEHLVICKEKKLAHISAPIDVYEMMGSSIHLHVKADDNSVIVIVPTMNFKEYSTSFVYGKKIYLSFKGDRVHLFDKKEQQ